MQAGQEPVLEQLISEVSAQLPAHRGEWLPVLLQNHHRVLEAYDKLGLGGASISDEVKDSISFLEAQANAISGFNLKSHQGNYDCLSRGFQRLQGIDREGYLAGVRTSFEYLSELIEESDDIACRMLQSAMPSPGISALAIRELRNECFQYRAVFQFMADRIAEALQNSQ